MNRGFGALMAVVLAAAWGATAVAPAAQSATIRAEQIVTTPHPTKVLSIIEENHSYTQMSNQMPYLWSLAQRYGYATDWTAIRHPSLPNYLAIVGGSTFGVTDDNDPVDHPINAVTVFDQAIDAGKRARLWAESMPANCYPVSASLYAVKHNPWAYFTPSQTRCNSFDVPAGSFLHAAANNGLPAVGMLVPNLCNDAHDCPLATADNWLKARLPTVLQSSDFTSGRLAVVVTADEDDRRSGNKVLTVVLAASLNGTVVTAPLTHYSLTRFYAQTLGVAPLLNGIGAPDMRAAFGL